MIPDFFSDDIKSSLHSRFGKSINVTFLQEEASTRRYYLIETEENKEVLCLDEKINEDFITLSHFLNEQGFVVPQVLHVEKQNNLLYQSFAGIKDFSSLPKEEYKSRLKEVLALLLRFQNLDPPELVKTRSFDFEKLLWEVQLTIDKFKLFQSSFGLKTKLSVEAEIFLEETCRYLDKYPVKVFAHRDFHCRNLLLSPDSQIALIDFQDARMGTPQYDLASILYDSYYPLPREFRQEMLAWFQPQSLGKNQTFKECFYLQALQRSFKALGTYFRMIVDHDKQKFRQSLVNCLAQMDEIIQTGMFPDSIYLFVKELQREIQRLPQFLNQ